MFLDSVFSLFLLSKNFKTFFEFICIRDISLHFFLMMHLSGFTIKAMLVLFVCLFIEVTLVNKII